MKKILITSILFFLVSTMFFSCSDENQPDNGVFRNDTQLQFKSVTVFDDRPESGNGTIREFANGDTIGLYLPEYHRGYPFPYIARYHYWWNLSEPIFLSSEPTRLFAYYPFELYNIIEK